MLDSLSQRLSKIVKTMRGQARLTEENTKDMLREVRIALLEADVALPVVREVLARIKEKAMGEEVVGNLNPGQALVGVVQRELTAIIGGDVPAAERDINLHTQPPAVILLAGLQGAGKTTNGAKLAGMMAAAILSDTVMFKSPTCTPRDIRTAERMARIADVSLDELGHEIFSAAVENKSVEEVFFTDYKEFHIAGHSLAVSQLTCVDSPSVLKRKDEFLKLMKKTADEKMFDLVIMMLTDVLLEGTQIIYVGDDDTIRQAFNVIPKDNTVFLPKVMSRKKQIIPMLSVLWG